MTEYRADIDGLRAIAVIPVLLYHAGVSGFSGGFVGVDIFFVISGYLICGMIAADLRRGTFSLANFYKRRILRILPALFVMFLITSVFAAIYCLPVELVDYARSLASAVASVSNVYFAQTAGYFDPPAETKPLLHTWSLSVEEQFYFAVPLLMLLIHRFVPKRVGILFAMVAAISFAGALAMSARNPTFAFYLTPFRAWELALGALLSAEFLPVPETAFWRNASGVSGLLLLFGVIAFGSSAMPLLAMTGLAALGTTLVIASSERSVSLVGRLLSLKPLVFVGLISYSLYLWHWPLIVFQRTDGIFFAVSSASAKLTLIVLSFGLAYLSWKLVETPFRSLAKGTSKAAIFGATSAAMLSTAGLCGMVIFLSGAPSRFPQRVVEIGSFLAYDSSAAFRTGRCFLSTSRQRLDTETCLKIDPARPNYLLVGDSHAAHLWSGLSQAMPEFNIMQATASLCRPAVTAGSRYDTPVCRAMMEFVFDDFLARNKVDGVLLAASWKDEDLPFLSATLQLLKSKRIDATVLGPIVEYDAALPRLLVDGILHATPSHASAKRTPGIRERDFAMRHMVTAAGASYLSVYDAMCRDDRCDEYARGDIPMQFDAGHLTAEGAIEVGRRLSVAFARKHARAADVSN
ncbi:acyltransferase family protein [Bradyrhizobium sp. CB3481]|uniref:acyltransferase family protein n=1 Tax=Bradyrhizobium sp. CB3481 TaxID=3039158 RepID=UPI0024B1C636|nr:acyltransferase family protein [Bradyrhizobium sp. CB3481]WFU17844.1 acyltransferase family protein [Bradyrhizobium sp. CB3481]